MTRRTLLIAMLLAASVAHAHGPGARERKGPHGGVLAALGWGFVEVTASATGEFRVFVLDWRGKPQSLQGWKGSVLPQIDEYAPVDLVNDGEELSGAGGPIVPTRFTIRVALIEPSGKTRSASLEIHL